METIFEDEEICITATGHDFDFIAIVENKTDKKMIVDFFGTEETLTIPKHNYIGLLADDEGRLMLSQFETMNFIVCLEE